MKSAEVLVTFHGYDWQNHFVMKSPTGSAVTLRCNGKWDMMSDELFNLINKYQHSDAGELPWGKPHKEVVTYDIMAEVLRLSKVS